jgi:hypothetical protein
MNIILLIICTLYLFNAIRIKNNYVNESNGFNTSGMEGIGHFVGTFLSCCTEGICWWYIIKSIINYYNI